MSLSSKKTEMSESKKKTIRVFLVVIIGIAIFGFGFFRIKRKVSSDFPRDYFQGVTAGFEMPDFEMPDFEAFLKEEIKEDGE